MEGIPVSELLKWAEKKRALEEAAVALASDPDKTPVNESDVDFDADFIKGIEYEFAQKADGILESLKLSHLNRLAMTAPREGPLKNDLQHLNELILSKT